MTVVLTLPPTAPRLCWMNYVPRPFQYVSRVAMHLGSWSQTEPFDLKIVLVNLRKLIDGLHVQVMQDMHTRAAQSSKEEATT